MSKSKQPNNGVQKGQRRQKLHDSQNNEGNEKNHPQYDNHNGESIY
ncbi:clostri-philic family protein [Clostridium sp. SHJSY1]|nr:clostri-philic family protein [Clostridium sp. SHJSY1]MDS0528159.1 clostri-philic family protein [Clostridium sp. SHJSY1]